MTPRNGRASREEVTPHDSAASADTAFRMAQAPTHNSHNLLAKMRLHN